MGFWIFMFLTCLMIPVLMIGFGRLCLKKPPKDINGVYGYRTKMSMKNKDTWEFAHKYFGKIWYHWGWIVLAVSVVVMLFTFGKSDDTVGYTGGILCYIQMVPLLVPIIPTEKALKKNFDKDGNRK